MKVKFWGVRGSIAAPGLPFSRYGGNTSCTEIILDDGSLIIFDSGTGIRPLGNQLVSMKKPIQGHIFITHAHWDHIQGFPFFVPALIPGNEFTVYGPHDTHGDLSDVFTGQMVPRYFPIQLKDMAAKLHFQNLNEGSFTVGDNKLETIFVNHPGLTLGYRIHADGKSIVYISDNEPYNYLPGSHAADHILKNPQFKKFDEFMEDPNKRVIDFAKGADILIHDTQYTPEEYPSKFTWGHSPYDYTVNIALQSEVKHLVLYHHDHMHTDEMMDDIVGKARALAEKKRPQMKVSGAMEGLELTP